MNQEIPVSHLVWRCSNFGEHVDAIVDKVNKKVTVTFDGGFLNSMKVLCEIYNEDPELANDIATDLPSITVKQSEEFENKLQELAEEVARSYKGKYCE